MAPPLLSLTLHHEQDVVTARLIAAVLYRDCNRRRDDSTIVVVSTRRD